MSGTAYTCRHGKAVNEVCEGCQRLGLAIAATKINPRLPISAFEWDHYGFRRA